MIIINIREIPPSPWKGARRAKVDEGRDEIFMNPRTKRSVLKEAIDMPKSERSKEAKNGRRLSLANCFTTG